MGDSPKRHAIRKGIADFRKMRGEIGIVENRQGAFGYGSARLLQGIRKPVSRIPVRENERSHGAGFSSFRGRNGHRINFAIEKTYDDPFPRGSYRYGVAIAAVGSGIGGIFGKRIEEREEFRDEIPFGQSVAHRNAQGFF